MRKLLSFVVCGALLSAPVISPAHQAAKAAAPKRIPVESFAALPFISDPALSPDGSKLAMRASADGKSVIAVYDLPTSANRQPTLLNLPDASFSWAGSNRLLLTQSAAVNLFGLSISASRLISYDLASKKTLELGAGPLLFGDGVLFTDPAGRYILRSKPPAKSREGYGVVRIDLETGGEVEVQPPVRNVLQWFVDSQGVVRAGLEMSGRTTGLLYRSRHGEALRRIERRKAAAAEDSVLDTFRFVENTDRGFAISNARTGRFGVYRYDFTADQIGEPVWEHPEVDALSIVAGERGELDGVSYIDDHPRVHWLDPEAGEVQKTVDRALPGKVNLIKGTSADRGKVLIWSGAASDPDTYYILDRKARKLELFASPHDALLDATLAPVEAVRYTARDGLGIRAYLTIPAGSPGKNLPLIVMPHGGPFARDNGQFDVLAQFLANRGYVVLQPNFRGSTGFGRAFVERGHGQWGSGMIDDIEAGVDWLAGWGMIDPRRVCILGISYGGYAAMWAPARSPDRYRCAVSMAGISDVSAMLKYDSRAMLAKRYARDWATRVRGEDDAKQDLKAISPLQQADRIRTPILIAHGELDTNVPPDQSRKLVKALEKRGRTVESIFYPTSGHGFHTIEDSVDFMKRVEAFLAKHNPA